MIRASIGIRNDYRGGIKDNKIELTLTLYKEITREDYDPIREYRSICAWECIVRNFNGTIQRMYSKTMC